MSSKSFITALNNATTNATNRQLREADTYALGAIMHHVSSIDKMLCGMILVGAFIAGCKTYDKYKKPKTEKADEE